jgi:hypothetical protein
MKNQQRLDLWRGHMEACRVSGLKVSEYCKKHSLATRRYYYWKLRVERSGHIETKGKSGKSPACGQWLCVEPIGAGNPLADAAPSTPDHLTLRISGAEIDIHSGFNPTLLRSIVQALGVKPC